jgi:hypothetical protein
MSMENILNMGIHDSIVSYINISYIKNELVLGIVANNKEVKIVCHNLVKIEGLNYYDNKNIPVVLEYELSLQSVKLFTTLSEWIVITAEYIEYE